MSWSAAQQRSIHLHWSLGQSLAWDIAAKEHRNWMTSSLESYIRLDRVEPKDSNASLHPYQMSGCGRPEEKFNLCVKLGKSVSSDILKLQEDEYSLHSLCKWWTL